jgi:hypothetical protein
MIFLGLGLLELALISAFFLALIVATAFDRRTTNEEPKWYLIGVGLVALAWYYWPEFTFIGPAHVDAVMGTGKDAATVITKAQDRVVLWEVVRNWSFWAPLAAYLGLGLVYSCLEFGLTIRRSARHLAGLWSDWLKTTESVRFKDNEGRVDISHADLIREARERGAEWGAFQTAVDAIKSFITNSCFRAQCQEDRIIGTVLGADKLSVEPKINRGELTEHVGAWTFLWPAYALSLIFGDLLTEFFRVVADVMVNLSGRIVKVAFRDVFKLA